VATTAPPPTKTVTLTIDGREALGPVISVLGMEKGGTAARPHPRTEQAPEEEGGDPQDPEDPSAAGRAEPGGEDPASPDREGGASP
jgi:hypothetical protein